MKRGERTEKGVRSRKVKEEEKEEGQNQKKKGDKRRMRKRV